MGDIMKHRPGCAKMACDHLADAVLFLPRFGPIYFCALHTLSNLKETTYNAN